MVESRNQTQKRGVKEMMSDRKIVAVRTDGSPCRFECHEREIPNINKVVWDAELFCAEDTNLRISGGTTAIVQCASDGSDVYPALAAAGYEILPA
jgi:hypothetical protein